MSTRRLILSIPATLVLAAAGVAADVTPGDQLPCVQGYPGLISPGGQQCMQDGSRDGECDCEACSGGSWWSRTTLGIRRHWFRHWQKQKHLQHPEAPPFFHANWGYHPTCWRRFPPICNPCPPVDNGSDFPVGHSQPVPQGALPPAPEPPRSSNNDMSLNPGVWSRVLSR